MNGVDLKAWRALVDRLLQPLRLAARFALRPSYRSTLLARLRHGAGAFQGVTTTGPNRYPVLFARCAELLRDVPEPRILSFGCSTGEEAETLARYMPTARIVGVDINRWCLRQSRRRASPERCTFLHRYARAFVESAPFDAIFCMAVLQRTEHRVGGADPRATGFTFARFEEELRMLDSKLKVAGYLFLDHADFRFEDTTVALRYVPIVFEGSSMHRERLLFGRNNERIAEQYEAQRCFQKRPAGAALVVDTTGDSASVEHGSRREP